MLTKTPHDILGNIAVLKFPEKTTQKQKKQTAKNFLKQNKNLKTILEKTAKVKGRLRKAKTKFIAGEKTKETIYTENNCKFLLNIDETYFSPRLASHRKETCQEITKKLTKNKNKVLVMFAGIAPWSIVLAKISKQQNKKPEIFSNEINTKANKYAKQNIELNKLTKYIEIVKGDAKKLPEKLKKQKFDFILMPRPNLKETFLKTALKLSKSGTEIYYHGFGKKQDVLEEIKNQTKNKISQIKIKKAGEIAPYKFRWLAKFKVK